MLLVLYAPKRATLKWWVLSTQMPVVFPPNAGAVTVTVGAVVPLMTLAELDGVWCSSDCSRGCGGLDGAGLMCVDVEEGVQVVLVSECRGEICLPLALVLNALNDLVGIRR